MPVPTRTREWRLRQCASRSAVIPSDKVSKCSSPGWPEVRMRSNTARTRLRTPAGTVGAVPGMHHHTTQTQLWQRRHGLRQRQGPRPGYPQPLLSGPIHVDLMQTVRASDAPAVVLPNAPVIFRHARWYASSRSVRPPGGSCCLHWARSASAAGRSHRRRAAIFLGQPS